MKRTNRCRNQLTLPTPVAMAPFADNAKTLSEIRYAVGFDNLFKLPRLDQLKFAPIEGTRSKYSLPVALLFGHYRSSDPTSGLNGLPIYIFVDDTTCEAPNVHIDLIWDKSFGIVVNHGRDGIYINGGTLNPGFFDDFDVFLESTVPLPCFAAMVDWSELVSQVHYCYLLAWECNMGAMLSQGVPTDRDIALILREMLNQGDSDVGSVATVVKHKPSSSFDADHSNSYRKRTRQDSGAQESQSETESEIDMLREWPEIIARSFSYQRKVILQMKVMHKKQQSLTRDWRRTRDLSSTAYQESRQIDGIHKKQPVLTQEWLSTYDMAASWYQDAKGEVDQMADKIEDMREQLKVWDSWEEDN